MRVDSRTRVAEYQTTEEGQRTRKFGLVLCGMVRGGYGKRVGCVVVVRWLLAAFEVGRLKWF